MLRGDAAARCLVIAAALTVAIHGQRVLPPGGLYGVARPPARLRPSKGLLRQLLRFRPGEFRLLLRDVGRTPSADRPMPIAHT